MYVLPQEDYSIKECHCNQSYVSGSQFLDLEVIIFPWHHEDHKSRFLGQTNYRDNLGQGY